LLDYTWRETPLEQAKHEERPGEKSVCSFINLHCLHKPGKRITFASFYEAFTTATNSKLSSIAVSKGLPECYAVIHGRDNKAFVPNLILK
jgi:hypothetical protein